MKQLRHSQSPVVSRVSRHDSPRYARSAGAATPIRLRSAAAIGVFENNLAQMDDNLSFMKEFKPLTEAAEEVILRAQEALNASRAVISLNRTQDGGDSVIEIPVPSAEDSLTDRLSLIEVIESLSIDERELIRLRYFKQKTQTETAAILNTTQVQISRREKKILTKMRALLV